MRDVLDETGDTLEAGAGPATDDGRDGLTERTMRGLGWAGAAQVGSHVLQTSTTIVLARLLRPEQFGQIAQVAVLIGAATLFSEFGFGAALVQRRDVDERHRSSVFWLQLGLGVAVALIVAASAPMIAAFYGEPDLQLLTVALAPTLVLSSLCTVQRGVLTRAMRFRTIAVIEVTALAVSGAVAIGLAAGGAGVTSIVAQKLAFTGAVACLLWAATSWRPRFVFHRQAIVDLLPFSRNLFGFTVVNFATRNGDNLLIGRFMGAGALGIYTRGYAILLYPTRRISSVIGRVMFPALSRIHDEPERVRRAYLRAASVIAFVSFPMMTGLAITADDFVPAVLGPQWTPAVPVIRIFCILGARESLASTLGWLYMSVGRTDVQFRWGLVSACVQLAGIALGVMGGTVETVTIGLAISTTLLVYPSFRIAGALVGMTFGDLVRAVSGIVACTASMAVVVLLVKAALPGDTSHLGALTVQAAVGSLTYVGLAHVTRLAAYQDLRARLRELRQTHQHATV